MMAFIREALRSHLSGPTRERIRLARWDLRFYIPRRLKSLCTRAHPTVEGRGDQLIRQIQRVNVTRPTRFCRTMTRYGSDKGNGRHTYTTVYAALVGGKRHEALRIFELGIARIGIDGHRGPSLRGWRDLFPRAEIYGADIDRANLFMESRISTFFCDQLDADAIRTLWAQPALREPMDIIVDDGLHTFEGNKSFLEGSLTSVRPGGLYVIEDITGATLDRWREQIALYASRYPQHEMALAQLPSPGNAYDNNLLIIRPHSQG